MAREAQEESSSSQSVNLTVTHIERGARGAAVCCSLSDGSSFFCHQRALSEAGIIQGCVVGPGVLGRLESLSALYEATDKAADYLADREHSARELELKLQKKGFDRGIAVEAVRVLADKGWQSDRRFAEGWIRSKLKRTPCGRGMLTAGLLAKGVDRNLAAEAVGSLFDRESALDALERAGEKYMRTGGRSYEKAAAHLLRKGFEYCDVRDYLSGVFRDGAANE